MFEINVTVENQNWRYAFFTTIFLYQYTGNFYCISQWGGRISSSDLDTTLPRLVCTFRDIGNQNHHQNQKNSWKIRIKYLEAFIIYYKHSPTTWICYKKKIWFSHGDFVFIIHANKWKNVLSVHNMFTWIFENGVSVMVVIMGFSYHSFLYHVLHWETSKTWT